MLQLYCSNEFQEKIRSIGCLRILLGIHCHWLVFCVPFPFFLYSLQSRSAKVTNGVTTTTTTSNDKPGFFAKLFGGASKPEAERIQLKPRKAPIKIEPKVFFANERCVFVTEIKVYWFVVIGTLYSRFANSQNLFGVDACVHHSSRSLDCNSCLFQQQEENSRSSDLWTDYASCCGLLYCIFHVSV